MCKAGFVEEKKSLKCRKGDLFNFFFKLTKYKVNKVEYEMQPQISSLFLANKNINERCLINEQCNGTENANTCRHIKNASRCSCNDGFALIHEKCLKSEKECISYPNKLLLYEREVDYLYFCCA